MTIRTATIADLPVLVKIEAACFPPNEAGGEAKTARRLQVFPNHFWLLEEDGQIVSFVDGMVTNEPTIYDELFADAMLHREDGAWQSIFGLHTLPEYRRRGHAEALLGVVAEDARSNGRQGCILTCKEHLIPYYEKFGYRNLGVSKSVHGGMVWYDMVLEF